MSLIHMTGVAKRYAVEAGPVTALHELDLDIAHNEYVAIVGPSGSGKSTLLGLIGCLERPSSGEYLLQGRDVGALGEAALAHIRNVEIGFVFQGFQLLPRATALANVMQPLVYRRMPRVERRRRALDALAAVGLSDRIQHLPQQLSGGQRQRVAIARALVTEPSVVLADEPTGNLDSRVSAQIMAMFDAMWREGRTVLIVTHEREIAAHCPRAVGLTDGRIVRDDRQPAPEWNAVRSPMAMQLPDDGGRIAATEGEASAHAYRGPAQVP